VDGRIVEIVIREGQEVEQGTPLFKVDDAQLRRRSRSSSARAICAAGAGTRQDLAQQNASSTADLEKAEAEARSAQAQYDLQRIRLERTTVRAPVRRRGGPTLRESRRLRHQHTKLASLHTVKPAAGDVPGAERFARSLSPGRRSRLPVAAIAGRDFIGQVDFVDPIVQLPAGRSWQGPGAQPPAPTAARVFIEPGSLRRASQRRRHPGGRGRAGRGARTPLGSWLTEG